MVIMVKKGGAVDVVSAVDVVKMGDPPGWDWASFGWGLLTGGVGTVVLGGAALYYGWPYIRAGLMVVPILQEIVK